jgi:hypothetical protein
MDCVICCDEIKDPDQMFKTPCGHVFHNSCLTPWFFKKPTCPVCRENFGDEDMDDESDEEDTEYYDSDNDDSSFTISYNFEEDNYPKRMIYLESLDYLTEHIGIIYDNPQIMIDKGMLNYVDGDRVYSVYSLVRNINSVTRIEFIYNKDRNHLDIDFISRQVFNNNGTYRVIGGWIFKRRANGYFNSDVACRV